MSNRLPFYHHAWFGLSVNEIIAYALEQPAEVEVGEIIIRSTAQP